MFKELHKPARRNFPRAPVMVKGIDDTWAIDLVDMGFHNNEKVIQENQGLKYMLTCIDVLSKYAWAVPMKTKDADTALAAIKHIIKESGRHPKKIYCDEGSEFKGVFRDYFRPSKGLRRTGPVDSDSKSDKYTCPYSETCGYKYEVTLPTIEKHLHSRSHHFNDEQVDKLRQQEFKLTIAEIDRGDRYKENRDAATIYHTYAQFHASPIERFNRTLKTRMWYKMGKHDSREWVSRLDKLLRKYNDTVHSATGMTPAKASHKVNQNALLELQKKKLERCKFKEPKLKLGDTVRVSKIKQAFEKGYTANWSKELYTVIEISYTCPVTYRIQTQEGENVAGSWYEEELQRSSIKPAD